jgi:hypothetical protein
VRLALAISVTIHVVGLAWATREHAKLVAVRPVTPPPAPVAEESPPIDVVVLDEPRDIPAVSHVTSHGEIAMATTTHATEAPRPTAEPPARPPLKHSPLMTMREPTIDQPLGDVLDQVAALPAVPTAPNPNNEKWVDHASADEVNGARLAREAEREAREADDLHPDGRGAKGEREAFKAKVASDGTVKFHNTPDVGDFHFYGIGIAGRVAWDDALIRKYSGDPYASAKRQWLAKTFDERAALGLANRKDELAHSASYMQKNLAWMWQKTRDPAERKEALFEMWDEVAESGDDDLIHGGEAARSYLVGFIRTHLPAGSEGAFSDAELAQLNAHRKSHAVFAPYE